MIHECPLCKQQFDGSNNTGRLITCPNCGTKFPASPANIAGRSRRPRSQHGSGCGPKLVALLILATGAFGCMMYHFNESPRQAWNRLREAGRRFVNPVPGATPAPAPAPVPVATPAPTPGLAKSPRPTPSGPLTRRIETEPPAQMPTPAPTVSTPAPATPTATPFTGFAAREEKESNVHADQVVLFDTTASGAEKTIKTWGAQTIGGPHVMQSCIDNMGINRIDLVLMMYFLKEPLDRNGELSEATKAQIDEQVAIARIAGRKPLVLSPDTEGGIHPWFHRNQREVFAGRWADLLIALNKHIRQPIAWVQPFNEPDYGWNQGTQRDLDEIMLKLRSEASFRSTQMAGPATLNVDFALDWFNAIRPRVAIATTHTLNGSFNSYVNFIRTVKNNGKTPFNPEIHNLVEAISGAEYGLEGGVFWMDCTPTRGAFVKACQGKRLGYAEDRAKWSAAAVYRAPGGAVRAFLGSNERQGQATTYRFVCRDREVYFDHDGPRKEYTVTIERDREKAIEITW